MEALSRGEPVDLTHLPPPPGPGTRSGHQPVDGGCYRQAPHCAGLLCPQTSCLQSHHHRHLSLQLLPQCRPRQVGSWDTLGGQTWIRQSSLPRPLTPDFRLAQRFLHPRGLCWRRWSSGWSDTAWLQPKLKPKGTSGRLACMSALSRCMGAEEVGGQPLETMSREP